MKTATASWKTTVLGIIAGAMLLLPQVKAVLDDDSSTNASPEAVMAALAAMGLGVAARDGNKSSQDHEIR